MAAAAQPIDSNGQKATGQKRTARQLDFAARWPSRAPLNNDSFPTDAQGIQREKAAIIRRADYSEVTSPLGAARQLSRRLPVAGGIAS